MTVGSAGRPAGRRVGLRAGSGQHFSVFAGPRAGSGHEFFYRVFFGPTRTRPDPRNAQVYVCVPSYMGMAVFLSDLLPPLSSLGSNDGSHPAALLSPSPYGLLFPTPTIAVSAASHLERREGTKSHRRPTPPWATFAYASLTGGPSTVDGEARVWV